MTDLLPILLNSLVTGLLNLVLFGLVLGARRLFSHAGLAAFQITPGPGWFRLLLVGAAAGALGIAAYMLLVLLAGQGRLTFEPGSWPSTLAVLAGWGFAFAGVALFEEGLFRGWLLPALSKRMPLWGALTLQALLFGLLHFASYNSSPTRWLGLLNAAFTGLVLGLATLRSGSLHWALGFHWAWNLAQTVLLRSPLAPAAGLLNLELQQGLWSGSTFIPESGLAVSLALLLVSAYLWTTGRNRLVA